MTVALDRRRGAVTAVQGPDRGQALGRLRLAKLAAALRSGIVVAAAGGHCDCGSVPVTERI